MPVFDFQCRSCGLKFEKLVKKEKKDLPQECSCGDLAHSLLSSVTQSYNLEAKDLGPQATGVSDWDANVDRIIAKNAKKNWAVVRQRTEAKKKIIEENKISGHWIARTPDNKYRVLEAQEKKAGDSARGLHDRAMAIKKELEHK